MNTIRDLPTPSFIVDLDLVENNCRRMREKAAASDVVLRPHVKTHKTIEGARLQLGAETGPITVSTLAEAEFFADAGFSDITYAVPIVPDKLDRVLRLQRRLKALHLLVDHQDAVSALDQFATSHATPLSVFIKVDCGYHRAGVDPESQRAIELARRIERSTSLALSGLLTHAGHSYHATGPAEIRAVAAEERRALAVLTERLEAKGLSPGIRSLGSTPTASVAEHFEGADEVRPGNYIFFDAFQASIGSCAWTDCAATVLASVISTQPEHRQILTDAGALALSKDPGATHIEGAQPSYGVVVDGGRILPRMRLTRLSQEHGQIETDSESAAGEMRIGDKIRIIMNHSCLTAAMFDRYHVVRGDQVIDEWYPVRGW